MGAELQNGDDGGVMVLNVKNYWSVACSLLFGNGNNCLFYGDAPVLSLCLYSPASEGFTHVHYL